MDKKAKNILFKTYWKNGWIDNADIQTSPTDFSYAKSMGVMFDRLTISHDQCVKEIGQIQLNISADTAAKALLSSLSSRRLDWRSGIASYFIARQMTPHTFTKAVSGHGYDENGTINHTWYTCGVCRDLKTGIVGEERYIDADVTVLNFERIKWGGVRHGDLLYTLFDLQQLQRTTIPEPTADDIFIFKSILKVIADSQPDDYPSALEKNLAAVVKSTKAERQVLMEILACIEILKPGSYDRPVRGKHDWMFVEYWRGEDKYNKEVVSNCFGKYL